MSLRRASDILILTILSIIVLPAFASAQGGSTISGAVYGTSRRPIDKARVELLNDMNSTIMRTETNASGRFSFTNVGTGRFQVRAFAPGTDYREETQSIEIGGGATRGFETVQVDLQLRTRSESDNKDPGMVVFFQEVPDEAKAHYTAALGDFENNQIPTALDKLKQAIAVFPTYFVALERLGVEQMKLKNYTEARLTFAAAAAVNSKSYNCWYGLAYAEFATDHFTESVDAAGKAIILDKTSAPAHFVLGLSQRRLKDFKSAEKSMVRAKDLDKGHTPDINWNLALLYAHNLQQYGKAADELELFLKATPNNPDTANIKKLIANFREKQSGSK